MKRGEKIPVYPGEWIWTKIGKDRVEISVQEILLTEDNEGDFKPISTAYIDFDFNRPIIPNSRKCREQNCKGCKYDKGRICLLEEEVYKKVEECYKNMGLKMESYYDRELIPLAQIGHGKMFKLVRPKRKKNE